jgi:hypothetical protein
LRASRATYITAGAAVGVVSLEMSAGIATGIETRTALALTSNASRPFLTGVPTGATVLIVCLQVGTGVSAGVGVAITLAFASSARETGWT